MIHVHQNQRYNSALTINYSVSAVVAPASNCDFFFFFALLEQQMSGTLFNFITCVKYTFTMAFRARINGQKYFNSWHTEYEKTSKRLCRYFARKYINRDSLSPRHELWFFSFVSFTFKIFCYELNKVCLPRVSNILSCKLSDFLNNVFLFFFLQRK